MIVHEDMEFQAAEIENLSRQYALAMTTGVNGLCRRGLLDEKVCSLP